MRSESGQKRQRASHACDFCHARGLKCHQAPWSVDQPPGSRAAGCLTCTAYGVECKINRPIRRRGRKPLVPPEELDMLEDTPPKDPQDSGFKSLHTIWRLTRIYRNTMYQC